MTKVTLRDLEAVNYLFKRYGSSTGNPWFSYAVSRNILLVGPFMKSLEDARKPSPMEEEYRKAREVLIQEHAKKDDKGKPIRHHINMPGTGQQGFRYELEDDQAFPAIEEAFMDEKFPELRDFTENKLKELVTLMDKEVEIDFHIIKMSQVPEKLISGNDMATLIAKGILLWDLDEKIEEDKEVKKEK